MFEENGQTGRHELENQNYICQASQSNNREELSQKRVWWNFEGQMCWYIALQTVKPSWVAKPWEIWKGYQEHWDTVLQEQTVRLVEETRLDRSSFRVTFSEEGQTNGWEWKAVKAKTALIHIRTKTL